MRGTKVSHFFQSRVSKWTSCAITALFLSVFSVAVQADFVQFTLSGNGGSGLLGDNVTPPTGETGTGGIGANGIWFDTDTRDLHIHLEWGSENGYEDISQDVFLLHLHGPTQSSAPDSFSETGPLIVALSQSASFDDSRTGGSVDDFWRIDQEDVDAILDNRTYINIHLAQGDGGILRGYLVAVPEPTCLIPMTLAGLALARRRRRLY
jgi:hypothetical protein